MVTRGRMVVAEAEETVLFDCAFHADQYNLFDYPVLWLKDQRLEETQMNVMGNLNEPFSSTDRIQVKMEVGADGEDKLYNVFLRISNVSLKDSGNYTCEIRGPKSTALNKVTHYLFVKTAVHSLFFGKQPSTLETQSSSSSSSSFYNIIHDHNHNELSHHRYHHRHHHPSISLKKLQLTELIHNQVVCTALGGYPPPTLTFHLARSHQKPANSSFLSPPTRTSSFSSFSSSSSSSSSSSKSFHEYGFPQTHEPLHDVTTYFPHFNRSFHVSGVPGLRNIVYRSERWGAEVKVWKGDDGALLGCTALVPGMEPVSIFVLLDVNYEPRITCQDTEASRGDADVLITCIVASKPHPIAIFWIIDQHGNSLTEGDVKEGLRTLSVTKGEHEQVIQLNIRRTGSEHFRKYSLVVENAVSVSTQHVFLRESGFWSKDRGADSALKLTATWFSTILPRNLIFCEEKFQTFPDIKIDCHRHHRYLCLSF